MWTCGNVPGTERDNYPAFPLPLLALCNCICDVLVPGLCFWPRNFNGTAQVSDNCHEYLFKSGQMENLITELV